MFLVHVQERPQSSGQDSGHSSVGDTIESSGPCPPCRSLGNLSSSPFPEASTSGPSSDTRGLPEAFLAAWDSPFLESKAILAARAAWTPSAT